MKTYFLLLISLAILIVSSCPKKIDHLKETGEGGDETGPGEWAVQGAQDKLY